MRVPVCGPVDRNESRVCQFTPPLQVRTEKTEIASALHVGVPRGRKGTAIEGPEQVLTSALTKHAVLSENHRCHAVCPKARFSYHST